MAKDVIGYLLFDIAGVVACVFMVRGIIKGFNKFFKELDEIQEAKLEKIRNTLNKH